MPQLAPTFKVKEILFTCVVVGLTSVLVARSAHLQLLQGKAFLQKADENRFYSLTLPAPRGAILDRYGQTLAYNTRRYLQVINPQALYAETVPVSSEAGLALLSTTSAEVILASDRQYQASQSLAHMVGYVGQVTAEDIVRDPKLRTRSQVGRTGLEAVYESSLQGQAGKALYEINALAQRQRLIRQDQPLAGLNLSSTFDPYLAEVAYQALGNTKGTVIVSDAETGALLAVVSTPSFDNSVMSQRPSSDEERTQRQQRVSEWFADPNQPFFNRSIAGAYPPGSVFKLVTALAGLESNRVDVTTTVLDEGVLKVGEFSYANWYYTQFGRTEGEIGLTRALARSNDIFFYKAAETVGPNALAEMARLVGFGQRTNLGFANEATGTVPDPAWKERVIGEQWYLGNTYHFGIGQGDILVTPLQVNQMVAAFANRGTQCQPQIVTKIGDRAQPVNCHELGASETHINTILEGMIQACSNGGTAFPFFPHNQRYAVDADPQTQLKAGMVACKTGTAEFGPADERGYRATHAWFVAVVEPQITTRENEQTPEVASAAATLDREEFGDAREVWLQQLAVRPLPRRLVLTVLVESDDENKFREGSRDAAPVALKVVEQLF